ncbi:choline dehydrogenase [Staphylococcus gallinarum]|uniref:Choline dehydrogenase n=1 Tax=Staphylococcus gallinarum TaxID=1293 RepID=A0A380FLP6_STAGA|nr:choline dehydrogenase [Staphylococcus gallinarum]
MGQSTLHNYYNYLVLVIQNTYVSVGIEPRLHLPGVGENFEDHLEVYVQHACKEPVSMQPSLNKLKMPFIGLQWIFGRKGAAASNHFRRRRIRTFK